MMKARWRLLRFEDEDLSEESAEAAGRIGRELLQELNDPKVAEEFFRITKCFGRAGGDPPIPSLATAKALHIIADSLEQTFGGEQAEDADDDSAWSRRRAG